MMRRGNDAIAYICVGMCGARLTRKRRRKGNGDKLVVWREVEAEGRRSAGAGGGMCVVVTSMAAK